MSGLHQEIVFNYTAFQKRIKELEALNAASSSDSKVPIYVIFSGNYTSGPAGKSWCGLCNAVNDFIQRDIIPAHTDKGYLIFARVGDQDEWADQENPFRKDPKIKIKSIPAAILWGTEKKLEGFQMARGALIKELFSIEDLFTGLKLQPEATSK